MRDEVIQASDRIDELEDEMTDALIKLCSIRAISPKSDGDGEMKKALWLADYCKKIGFSDIKWYNSPDKTVSAKERPNIIVTVPGKDRSRTTWVITHTDVVPEGDLNKWICDPFKPIKKDGKIIGRGVEDNGQELISSLFAAKAIIDKGLKPKYDIGLAFVADEEVGSVHGIQYLLKKKLFRSKDLVVVPDSGTKHGEMIEIAEKTSAWLKITTYGKQAHGSMPHKGKNAYKAAAALVCALDNVLYKKFDRREKMFSPEISTFEPTKKEANVPNINTIPGEDVYYMDCRILPYYTSKDVMKTINSEARKVEKRFGVKFKIENIREPECSPMTSIKSEIYVKLSDAVKEVKGFRPEPQGIGGGTCAAFFRKAGLPAVVWTTSDEVPHEANEYVWIKNLINDAKVYASLFL